jgi:hypothetical protein
MTHSNAIFQAQKCNKNSTADLKSATTTQQLKTIDIQTLSPSCKREAQRFAQEIKFAQRSISLSLLLLWQPVFILEKQLSCQEPNKYSSKKPPPSASRKLVKKITPNAPSSNFEISSPSSVMAVVGRLSPPPLSLLQSDMFLLVWLPSLHVLYIWKMSRSIISPLIFFFFFFFVLLSLILTKVVVHKYNPFFFWVKDLWS